MLLWLIPTRLLDMLLFFLRRVLLLFNVTLVLLGSDRRQTGLLLWLNWVHLDYIVPHLIELFVELLDQVLIWGFHLWILVQLLSILLILVTLKLLILRKSFLPIFDELVGVFTYLWLEFGRLLPLLFSLHIIECILRLILTLISIQPSQARRWLLQSWSHWLELIVMFQFLHLLSHSLLF